MTKSWRKRIGLASAGFVVGLAVSLIAVSPSHATTTYNRSGVVSYAKKYACNDDMSCQNPGYMRMGFILYNDGSDCANFVSQSINVGGGLPSVYSGPTELRWFYDEMPLGAYTGTASWVKVSDLYYELAVSNRMSYSTMPTMTNQYSGAKPGDVYMYDWGQGEGYSHMAIATGDGTFATYMDPYNKDKNYNSVTAGAGSKIAQHSRDRDGAPWNWGYWTQGNPTIKKLMRTMVIHMSDVIF